MLFLTNNQLQTTVERRRAGLVSCHIIPVSEQHFYYLLYRHLFIMLYRLLCHISFLFASICISIHIYFLCLNDARSFIQRAPLRPEARSEDGRDN